MATLATNKRARFDYEIFETLEAGLVLSGGEVKSIREGHVRLSGSYVIIRGNEAYLINLHIPKYSMAGATAPHAPERNKKLLLSGKEIAMLRGRSDTRGLTIIPLSLYTKGPLIKAEIAVVRGKKKYDKREAIKKRDLRKVI